MCDTVVPTLPCNEEGGLMVDRETTKNDQKITKNDQKTEADQKAAEDDPQTEDETDMTEMDIHIYFYENFVECGKASWEIFENFDDVPRFEGIYKESALEVYAYDPPELDTDLIVETVDNALETIQEEDEEKEVESYYVFVEFNITKTIPIIDPNHNDYSHADHELEIQFESTPKEFMSKFKEEIGKINDYNSDVQWSAGPRY